MEATGHTGMETGAHCELFRHQLSPLCPDNENLVTMSFDVGFFRGFGGFFDGWEWPRWGGVAVTSVTADKIKYWGHHQVSLVRI